MSERSVTSKGAIRRWTRAIGLKEDAIWDGFQPWISLTEPFRYIDGRLAEGVVEFGQSVAVLRKEEAPNKTSTPIAAGAPAAQEPPQP